MMRLGAMVERESMHLRNSKLHLLRGSGPVAGNLMKKLMAILLILFLAPSGVFTVFGRDSTGAGFSSAEFLTKIAASQGVSINAGRVLKAIVGLDFTGQGALTFEILSDDVFRLGCNKTASFLGEEVDLRAWADVRTNGSRFTRIHDKGAFFNDRSPTFNFVLSGTTTAYLRNSGNRVDIRFSGTVEIYLLSIWIASKEASISCFHTHQ